MNTKRMVQLAILVAVAGVLHFVESAFPIPFPVPGFKLGFANLVTLFVLAVFGLKDALVVSVVRVTLGTLMTGTLFGMTFLMALAGAFVSCLVMYAAKKWLTPAFSLVGVSIIGAVGHNVAQLCVAMVVLEAPDLVYYLPYLTLFAVLAGSLTGLCVVGLMKKLPVKMLIRT
jgi:heptaprenyl diphosphate synthase